MGPFLSLRSGTKRTIFCPKHSPTSLKKKESLADLELSGAWETEKLMVVKINFK